jgi:hypothetical protein
MLSSLKTRTGLSALALRAFAYLLLVIAIGGAGYYYGSSSTADRYEAIAAKLEQIRQKSETQQLRKNEIAQRNATEIIAKNDQELQNAKNNQKRSADSLRTLIASLPDRTNTSDRGKPSDAPDKSRASGTCEPTFELFRRTAEHAARLALRADALSVQVAGLQAYGQACHRLTNPE